MQRLYFNFSGGDVRLVPLSSCPSIEEETNFPNTDVPDNVTLSMISFKWVDGLLVPQINYPKIDSSMVKPTTSLPSFIAVPTVVNEKESKDGNANGTVKFD